jgi:hypothetical protein
VGCGACALTMAAHVRTLRITGTLVIGLSFSW